MYVDDKLMCCFKIIKSAENKGSVEEEKE